MTRFVTDALINELAARVVKDAWETNYGNPTVDSVTNAARKALRELANRMAGTKCAFCDNRSHDPCGDNWIPSYVDMNRNPPTGEEVDNPVCPDCIGRWEVVWSPTYWDYERPVTR